MWKLYFSVIYIFWLPMRLDIPFWGGSNIFFESIVFISDSLTVSLEVIFTFFSILSLLHQHFTSCLKWHPHTETIKICSFFFSEIYFIVWNFYFIYMGFIFMCRLDRNLASFFQRFPTVINITYFLFSLHCNEINLYYILFYIF